MSTAPHPDLDLAGTIRPGLDILANEIVIALKKRTRFLQNAPVYEPGLVLGDANSSLLDHVMARTEQCHAELGRYAFAAQDAFSDVSGTAVVIDREPPESPLMGMSSGVGQRIITFYRGWVGQACAPGLDASTYGETVTSDVAALLCIMERVNLGKSVAEAKFQEMPDAFRATGGDRDAMLVHIVRSDREVAVLDLARRLAEHYDVSPDLAVSVFEFMISTTIDIEVDYLRRRLGID